MRHASKRLFPWVVGSALALLLFLAYSYLPLAAPGIFNSPDENSNHVFSVRCAEEFRPYRVEILNVLIGDAVHPRSVAVVESVQVPGGFVGMPVIFGTVGRLVGLGSIPFLTPLLALLGVCAWGLTVTRLFGRRVGLLSAALLAVCPVWWYWSSRTMMPNVAFVSLAMMSLYFFVCLPLRRLGESSGREGSWVLRMADGAFAGAFGGLALAVRPVELYWILAAGLVALVVMRRVPWVRLISAAVFAGLVLVPFFQLNAALYGSLLSTGYGDAAATVGAGAHGGFGARLLGPLRPLLFPLGFAPRVALANFWTYGVAFFWWWSLPVAAAAVYWTLGQLLGQGKWRRPSRETWAFVAAGAVVVAWLVPFYGSWAIVDSPDPEAVTIGSSYFRYWLPIFVLSTVPLAALVDRLAREFRDRRAGSVLPVLAVATLAVVSGAVVFGASGEGLARVRANLSRYAEERELVLSLTEDDALVVVDRADKYLYPDRAVVYPLRSERTYELLPRAVTVVPTYYFGMTLPERDLNWLNRTKLPPLDLQIVPVAEIGDKTLYRLDTTEAPYMNADPDEAGS